MQVFNNSLGFFLDFGGDSIDFDVCSISIELRDLRENYTCSAINSRKCDLISNASPSIDRKVFAARIIIFWNNARKSDPFVNQCELKIIETIEKINPFPYHHESDS